METGAERGSFGEVVGKDFLELVAVLPEFAGLVGANGDKLGLGGTD